MGSRLLDNWLNNPLRQMAQIEERYATVSALQTHYKPLQTILRRISDIERITSRVALRSARPRDLAALQ